MKLQATRLNADVSRETFKLLMSFDAMVKKWSNSVNLIGRDTLSHLWQRHIEDSLFLAKLMPGSSPWLDIGSGAGFPGIVVAILYGDQRSVTLVESDSRKAEFLKAVRRELGIKVKIFNRRIQEVEPGEYHVISARALAPLNKLFELCEDHIGSETALVFPKGKSWQQEVLTSNELWTYDVEVIDNPTSAYGVVLKVMNLVRSAQ